uniref:Uncharacterized protein n=1 Tax=Fagus sylvatica TaxID=28930 RepID=A0A2N9G1X4_FAGSY
MGLGQPNSRATPARNCAGLQSPRKPATVLDPNGCLSRSSAPLRSTQASIRSRRPLNQQAAATGLHSGIHSLSNY